MIWKTGVRNLLRNRRRTLSVLITVGMGTGSLFLFHGFNNGIMNQYRDGTIHARYGNGQINTHGYREQVFEKPWEHWIEDYPKVSEELRKTPGVTHVFPRLEFFAMLTNGTVNVSGRGQGVDGKEEHEFFTAINIVKGKMLSDEPDGVILGIGLARSLNVGIGDRVTVLANTVNGTLNGADLTVVGIFHGGMKEFDDVYFRLPLQVAQTLLDTSKVESVVVGLDRVESWANVAKMAKEKFPSYDAIPFQVLDKIYYQHSVDWLDSQFGAIQAIILAVVILGIFNTVSTGVLERKQEIGNLRANGESYSDVMKLLLAEGVSLGALGSLAGILLGLTIAYGFLRNGILMPPAPGLTRQFFVRIELEPMMAVKTFAMGSASAVLATVLAARKVAKANIGDLLRSV